MRWLLLQRLRHFWHSGVLVKFRCGPSFLILRDRFQITVVVLGRDPIRWLALTKVFSFKFNAVGVIFYNLKVIYCIVCWSFDRPGNVCLLLNWDCLGKLYWRYFHFSGAFRVSSLILILELRVRRVVGQVPSKFDIVLHRYSFSYIEYLTLLAERTIAHIITARTSMLSINPGQVLQILIIVFSLLLLIIHVDCGIMTFANRPLSCCLFHQLRITVVTLFTPAFD